MVLKEVLCSGFQQVVSHVLQEVFALVGAAEA